MVTEKQGMPQSAMVTDRSVPVHGGMKHQIYIDNKRRQYHLCYDWGIADPTYIMATGQGRLEIFYFGIPPL